MFKKSKQVSIPDSAKSQPVPREAKEINAQYTEVCTQLGHNKVNQDLLKKQESQLLKYIESFSNEMKAREALDQTKLAEENTEALVEAQLNA